VFFLLSSTVIWIGFDIGEYCLTLFSVRTVVATTKMQEHAGSDKSCMWHALDLADGELKEEMFAIRFGSVESEHHILPLYLSLHLFIASSLHCHNVW